ncbi:hypothetical protein JOD31_002230 [Methylopila capsulata]|uniref:Uncharacterized protein n=1 Tax=Methylopila capsulata TaxID=61654 RepID=A0A9W6ITM8_9HYPH|nr:MULTISPECIES: hypothetical protein [Methylopila]MBM7852005.1 hypothetical protein [Methylopila capsulata]GLK55070.1 hypothetical protein GCM10008170_10890 [Methylopila capsulata]
MQVTKETLFKASKAEMKGDATTRAAREIIDRDRAQQDAKTERLRLARMERDAAEQAAAPPPVVKKTRKRAASAA